MINKTTQSKVWSEIKKANNILLTLHPSPDGDSIGSNLALFHTLKKMNKKVTLIGGDTVFPKNFSSLPGSDQIASKNFFQTDLNDYDLFIIADISSPKQISKYGEVDIPKTLKTIIIDHHPTNSKFADINLIDPKAPATCQIVYHLLVDHRIKITKNIAACLFAGLYTDTGGFKYLNTTHNTFSIASKLTETYTDFNKLIFEIENNDHPDRLKFLSLMLNSVETYISDKIAIASIDFNTIQKNQISNEVVNGSDIANQLKSVIGWEIGISLIEIQPNLIKVSFRTRNSKLYDLTKISTAIGGGGHKSAAGATLNDLSLSEAKDLILKTANKVYPSLK